MRGFEIAFWSLSPPSPPLLTKIPPHPILEALFGLWLYFKVSCQWFSHHQLFTALSALTPSKNVELFGVRASSLYFQHTAQRWSEEGPATPPLYSGHLELKQLTSLSKLSKYQALWRWWTHICFFGCLTSPVSSIVCSLQITGTGGPLWQTATKAFCWGEENKNQKTRMWVSSFSRRIVRIEGSRVGMQKHLEPSENMFLSLSLDLLTSLHTLRGHRTSAKV